MVNRGEGDQKDKEDKANESEIERDDMKKEEGGSWIHSWGDSSPG